MRIRWTPAAAADLQHISNHLREHHPQYRQPTIRKLYEFVVYRVSPADIEILRIYHSSQERA